ncbi:protein NLRC5-like [Stylophora pistillata]|uniref:protein NLRC5-like n=1 Tax=Stylophora pistillata TaxID=50429 RepID=UPI000C044569|nr:protein NLRC5-like [Stylophora pistillata]
MKETLMRLENEMKEMKEKLGSLIASKEESTDLGIFDPSELINRIRQLYKSREGRLSPFPWCEEFQFFLGNIFTRLKVVRRNKTGRKVKDMFVDMSSILDPYEGCSAPRTALIEGEPGMGKTTYCKKYVYDWATKEEEPQGCGATAFKAVLLLNCRDIHSKIWEAIEDQLLPRDIDEKVKQNFFQFIRENQSSILLILDGLDELPSSKLPTFSEWIEGRILPGCHIVATARHEAGKEVRKCCDALLEIVGFAAEDVDKYVIKYFKDSPNLATKLLERIRRDKNLKEMAVNPLNTTLLCLLCEEFDGTFPENRAQLYLDMVECVLRRYRKKKGQTTNVDLKKLYQPQLNHLGLVALNGLFNDKLDFDKRELGNLAKDLTEFGFLSGQPGGSRLRQNIHYAFLHKSFQEFFAAFFICSKIHGKEITAEELVSDERCFSELCPVLLFTCGILSTQCSEEVVPLINSLANQVSENEGIGTNVVLAAINECKGEQCFPLQLAKWFGSGLNLTELDLSRSLIGDTCATLIAEAIKGNKTLTNLNLSGNRITNADPTSIAEAIKVINTLTNLDLSDNLITDSGATSIAESLTYLNFSGCRITDAGAASLFEAVKVNKTMMELSLP